MKAKKWLSIALAACMLAAQMTTVTFAEEIPTATKETVEETVSENETVPEEETSAVAETEPETVAETESVAETEAESETETEAESESETETIPETETETVPESSSEAESSKAAEETTSPKVEKTKEEILLVSELDDVIVTLRADGDAFEYENELSMEVTPVEITEKEEKALDKVEKKNVAKRLTYDITIFDGETPVEPVKEVDVSFELKNVPSGANGVNIFHHDETDGIEKIATEDLTKDTEGEPVETTVDSFSLYTLDFTYEDLTVSIAGDSTGNSLEAIIEELGIEEEIEEAIPYQDAACTKEAEDGEVKNEEGDTLFAVYDSGDGWCVDAVNSFDTEHGLVIKTVDGAEYKIKVTDPIANTYEPLTLTAVGGTVKIQLMKSQATSGALTEALLYSTSDDGSSWNDYTYAQDGTGKDITLTEGKAVRFKAKSTNETFSFEKVNMLYFNMEPDNGAPGTIKADGDIESLMGCEPSDFCFYKLFQNCQCLTKAPDFNATTLAKSCYEGMFSGCTGLKKSPVLPATTLAESCYEDMFYDCTSLETAPALPATTLAVNCYRNMFNNCISLETAPVLPATEMEVNCYSGMFSSCKKLKTTPDLPATVLADGCYQLMFTECSELKTAMSSIPASVLAKACCDSMFLDCNKLEATPSLPAKTMADNCYNRMFHGCSSLTQVPDLPGETLAKACYEGMFSNCTGLTTVPVNLLPVTEMAVSCYSSMFNGCSNLTTTLKLPSETMADWCYSYMFCQCTSLTKAPALPAKALAKGCYQGMFGLCTSLTKAPALPAKTMAEGCYLEMFSGCTQLETAPQISATVLAPTCFSTMFMGCIKLETVPQIPATVLASNCFCAMFYGCTNLLLKNVPDVANGITRPWIITATAVTEWNDYMFTDCTKVSIGSGNVPEVYTTYYTKGSAILTVTFDTQGHGTSPEKQSVQCGTCASMPAAPSAVGYVFSGWYMDADCTEAWDFGTSVLDDMILYAKWTAEEPVPPVAPVEEVEEEDAILTTNKGTGSWDVPATGAWTKNADGSWSFGNAGIAEFKNTWAYIATSNASKADWYYFGTDGKAKTGFVEIEGKTYYFRETKDERECAMETGWKEINYKNYHFKAGRNSNTGVMDTGWYLDMDDSWYYLEKTQDRNRGSMQLGWRNDEDDGFRYYLDPETGKMLTGWAVVDGKKHYFNEVVPSASGWTMDSKEDWVYENKGMVPLGAMTE